MAQPRTNSRAAARSWTATAVGAVALLAGTSAAHAQGAPAPATPRDSTGRTDSTRARRLEGVTVTAVRGGAPAARTTLGAGELARGYTGQDVPLVLQRAPAVSAYAEGGSQYNYSYFRLRGIDQSRINLTLDGIPLNEPEDQQAYFSNFPDLTNSLQSVQVQRGVGTSSYGQASFGGSVNLETLALAGSRRGGEVQLGGGSFGNARGSVEYQTGQLSNGTAFYGRVSNQREDGYRRGSSHAGNSQFLSGGYFGARDVVKFTALTGVESNGQAYTAVPLATLERDPRANPLDGVADRYRQSMGALSYTRLLSANASVATTVYGFRTGGTYDYPSEAPEPAYRFGSRSRWGGVLSALHAARGPATLDAGVHASTYSKDHTFAGFAATSPGRAYLDLDAYANRSGKREGSAFAKAGYALGAATLTADLQVRRASVRYRPTDGAAVPEARAAWTFFNPRAGVSYRAAPALTLFGSYGQTRREPTRADLLAGADNVDTATAAELLPLDRVRPERVRDLELGADAAVGPVRLRAVGYAMRFRDEITRTGGTTALGYDLRANVPSSYRRGVELETSWRAGPALTLAGTLALSANAIAAYRDEAGDTVRVFRDVDPILTPRVLSTQQVTWRLAPALAVTADGRYQGRAFLAPTGDPTLTAPPFFVADGGAVVGAGRYTLLVQGRNLLDRRAYPSGNVSGSGVARFYILAPRHVAVTGRLAF
jgi:iron complex outermembrane receptor protein